MTVSSAFPWHRPCPVCLSDRPDSLYLNTMAAVGEFDLSYRVCRCGHCGFNYAAALAQPASYDAYYRDVSKYDVPRMADFPSTLERHRALAAVAACQPHISANAAIADIGCGRGALLHTFHAAGFKRVYGLDPAPASAASLGIGPVLQGTIKDAPQKLPLTELDLVCLTGVLEHLPELRQDLQRLAASLSPRTRVLIEVPALECFVRPQMEPLGEFSLEHLQYFSQLSLARLMASIGYASLAMEVVPLHGASDSLFGLFARSDSLPADVLYPEPSASMTAYIESSKRCLDAVLNSLAATPAHFALYGAGSHSARLMPMLDELGLLARIDCVVDGNANLQGKRLGSFLVQPPAVLDSEPELPVLISSFHAQAAIARALADKHPQRPLVLLYAPDDARQDG